MVASPIPIWQILDPQTQQLVQTISSSDYVMSNEIVSSYISQVAENKYLHSVLSELLTSQGCELSLREISLYTNRPGESVSFWILQARARLMNEVTTNQALCWDQKT